MTNARERVIEIIKQQAELFLLDAKEFYPFGTCIDKQDKIIPVGAYAEGDHPLSNELIKLLEKDFTQGIANGYYKIAVIAIDILIKKDSEKFDGIEMRFFEPDKNTHVILYRYQINENSVSFFEHEI